jgi:hypothetical protein
VPPALVENTDDAQITDRRPHHGPARSSLSAQEPKPAPIPVPKPISSPSAARIYLEAMDVTFTTDPAGEVVAALVRCTSDLTDADVSLFRHFPKLEKLNIVGDSATDAGLAHLKELPELKELSLYRDHFTGAGMAHLKDVKNLQRLTLLRSDLTDKDLEPLAGEGAGVAGAAGAPAHLARPGPSQEAARTSGTGVPRESLRRRRREHDPDAGRSEGRPGSRDGRAATATDRRITGTRYASIIRHNGGRADKPGGDETAPRRTTVADTIREKIENAGEAVKDAAKKAGEKVQEGAEKAAEKTADATHKAGEAVKDAGQKLKDKSGA